MEDNRLQLLEVMDKNLKFVLISIWIFVLAFIFWPSISSELPVVDKIFVNNAEADGIVLEPMRPVSERLGITSVLTYPTVSAPGVDGYYISGSFVTKDVRVAVLQQYLLSKGSPMAPYSGVIVASADENQIDFRPFVAISGVESGFGKVGYAARIGYNPIGWRGGGDGKFNIFSSWNESIPYLVGKFAKYYGENFDPLAIQGIYCPPCEEAGTNEWANGVERYINEIEYLFNSI